MMNNKCNYIEFDKQATSQFRCLEQAIRTYIQDFDVEFLKFEFIKDEIDDKFFGVVKYTVKE